MIKQSILTSITALFCAMIVSCQQQQQTTFKGSWKGTLSVGVELPIIFHVTKDDKGSWKSTADSPDQNAFGIPCDTTIVNGSTIKIEMHSLQAAFSGKLINDSTIDGTFTQGGDLPLTLKRITDEKPKADEKKTSRHYRTEPVEIKAKDVTLRGDFFDASFNNKKALLIIAGSGPTDRDGNSPLLPGKNNSLLDLADSLSEQGIATLRYDKRGIAKSKMADGIGEEQMTITNMIDDAVLMTDWLKKKGFEQIYIAGHSEGSLIGMIAAQKTNAAGFISIAGAGRPAEIILKEQLSKQVPASTLANFEKALDSVKKGMTVTASDDLMKSLLRPSVQPYMRSWLTLDPAKEIAKLKCPVLIIQGDKDLQVTVSDAQLLNKALPKSKLGIIASMNHVLKYIGN
ncbi:MAG TPA: alpha/beta hydrolase, partial [Chitinophagaceae bacterium]|nr:alpha/beta hydrolase [Chitinophagaceae bacterium]